MRKNNAILNLKKEIKTMVITEDGMVVTYEEFLDLVSFRPLAGVS